MIWGECKRLILQEFSSFQAIWRKLEDIFKIGLVRQGLISRVAPPTARAADVFHRGSLNYRENLSGAAPEKSFYKVALSSLRFVPKSRENQNHAGKYADHQSARSQGTPHSGRKVEVTRSRELPTAPRSMSSSHDTDAQEAELGSP